MSTGSTTPTDRLSGLVALAAFKRPRYVAYVDEFPRTATNKIAKSQITSADISGVITDLQEQRIVTDENVGRLLPS